jgi:tetratricopeptide (TPR) repeat protein
MYRQLLTSLIAMAFLSGNQVSAGETKTDDLINQVSAYYGDLDYEKALGTLQKAFQTPGNTRAQLVRMYHLSGLCLSSLGRYREAEDSFGRLLVLDPSFRLSADVSPRIREPFDRLVKKNMPRVNVRLVPPAYAQLGQPLTFGAEVVSDPMGMIEAVRVFFRRGEAGRFSSVRSPVEGPGEQPVNASAAAWEGDGKGKKVFWYAVAEGANRSRLQEFGDDAHPSALEVSEKSPEEIAAAGETAWYERWWVWAIIGGVAAAATTTAVVLTTQQTPSGPFDFSVDFSTLE